MASSTLDPDNEPIRDRITDRGRGTRQLGPSDSSDNGSDVQDSVRWTEENDIGLDKGTTDDPDSAAADPSAGPDLGDAWLDSDTDSHGSGEAAAAGRDPAIRPETAADRIDYIDADEAPDFEQMAGEEEAGNEEVDDELPPITETTRVRAQRHQSRR